MGDLGDGTGSSYPGALDTDTTQESTTTTARSDVPNDLAAAIIAIETELGTDPAGSLSNVKTYLQTQHEANGTHAGKVALTTGSSVTWDVLPNGAVVQVVNTQTGAVATGTTPLPSADDTIPQNTEGDQYMTLAITPKATTNKLKIDVVFNGGHSVEDNFAVALFQDTTADALASVIQHLGAPTRMELFTFTHYMAAGTVSATTFKVRAGATSAGTTTFNGVSGSRRQGGVLASSITITEVKA